MVELEILVVLFFLLGAMVVPWLRLVELLALFFFFFNPRLHCAWHTFITQFSVMPMLFESWKIQNDQHILSSEVKLVILTYCQPVVSRPRMCGGGGGLLGLPEG